MFCSRVRLFPSIAVVVLFGWILLQPQIVHAANTSISLTTSPVVLDLVIKPGQTDTRDLQLMNNSSQAIKIDMQLDVFSAKGDSGNPIIAAPLANDPSVNWVSFSPSSFIAQPGVWSHVKMTINLPRSASLGYYYAVLFKPDIANQPSANTTTVNGTNAILALIDTSSGNESRQVSIDGFSVSQNLYEYLPATFNVTVHNSGNIYLAPVGDIYISQNQDMSNDIAVLDINPNGGNILPRTSRTYQVQWTDGFPLFEDKKVNGQTVYDASGKPVTQLSWSFAKLNKIRFGKYYAKVTLVYNDGKRVIPLTRVVSFWVIPWKLLIGTALVLVVLVIGLLTIGRFFAHTIRRTRTYRR